MFANKIKINLDVFDNGATATTINVPINMEYQIVDQAELVDDVFVSVETEKAVNPIIDYEKTRFSPIDMVENVVDRITYTVTIDGTSNYGDAGFNQDDIKLRKETFKQTFLNLSFYDTDNPMTQNLISFITLYPEIKSSDLLPVSGTYGLAGQPKPANQIPLSFVLENPNKSIFSSVEGYFIYDYQDELKVGESKFLYMRASFKNAKTGKSTNMMVKNIALPIDNLIHEIYTRYKLTRTENGYFYQIDDTYNGDSPDNFNQNNVIYSSGDNSVLINLYNIRAI